MRNALLLAAALLIASPALAADPTEIHLTIKNHVFTPASIDVAAGQKVKLVIENQDATAEEFDSHDLKREKVIPANGTASVHIGPLDAGTYKFAGEYHEATAKGVIVVK